MSFSQKLLQGLESHELTAYLSGFYLFFDSLIWLYYEKNVNQVTLNLTIL